MARDQEPQPETPLLGEAVQLDSQETLTGDPNVDPLDAGYIPPDRPTVIDEGTTAEETVQGPSLDERLAQEQPDTGESEPDPRELTLDEPEDEYEAALREVEADRAGRLLADDEGARHDDEPDLVAHDRGIDGGAASAEEAAVHEMDEDQTFR